MCTCPRISSFETTRQISMKLVVGVYNCQVNLTLFLIGPIKLSALHETQIELRDFSQKQYAIKTELVQDNKI
jgi:hypothetical protein